jgi:hypothetical protein
MYERRSAVVDNDGQRWQFHREFSDLILFLLPPHRTDDVRRDQRKKTAQMERMKPT